MAPETYKRTGKNVNSQKKKRNFEIYKFAILKLNKKKEKNLSGSPFNQPSQDAHIGKINLGFLVAFPLLPSPSVSLQKLLLKFNNLNEKAMMQSDDIIALQTKELKLKKILSRTKMNSDDIICSNKNELMCKKRNLKTMMESDDTFIPSTKELKSKKNNPKTIIENDDISSPKTKKSKLKEKNPETRLKLNGFIAFRTFYCKYIHNPEHQRQLSSYLGYLWDEEPGKEVWVSYACAYNGSKSNKGFFEWLCSNLGLKPKDLDLIDKRKELVTKKYEIPGNKIEDIYIAKTLD